ncbi:MAG: phage virion morphogenesis protein [Candidatus Dadabacteria bacterium]|nr:phage virion morphogenesis protein [Candidatus Dadabacteria bacterium]
MSIKKIGSFKFTLTKRLFKAQKRTLPIILGKDAKNFFLDSFRRMGFTDFNLKRWIPRRKRLTKGRTSPTLTESATLVKTGTLRRSIRVSPSTFRLTKIFTNLRYAAIHNFGLRGLAFGKNPFKMPERKFIGNSRVLERKLEQRILKEVNKVFK